MVELLLHCWKVTLPEYSPRSPSHNMQTDNTALAEVQQSHNIVA